LDAEGTTPKGAAKRLRAQVQALWDFALACPELYAVMFGGGGLAAHPDHDHDGLAPPSLRRTAGELVEKRKAVDPAADVADRVVATTHGFLALVLAGRFPGGTGRALTQLQSAVDAMVKNLGRN
jgi:hypothetical protein